MSSPLPYLEPAERDSRACARHPYRPGFCRWCGGVILVPDRKGSIKAHALRQWRHLRIEPTGYKTFSGVPAGWRVYLRANWHAWCDPMIVCLEKPSAWGVVAAGVADREACAICGITELGWGWRSIQWPWVTGNRSRYKRAIVQALEAAGWNVDKRVLEVDHRVPLWGGGKHLPSNLWILCQLCHARKTRDEAAARALAKRTRYEGPQAEQLTLG